jgi:HemY protein
MIRVVIFLAVVALIALGVAWIADRPGDVAITWHGWRIESSVMVTLVALIAIIALAIMAWSFIRGLVRSPRRLAEMFRRRRETRGFLAITRGLIAIGAGDAAAARRYSHEARRLASGEPLALLLDAQTAQLSGDRSAAERIFRSMAGRGDTKLLGLRGLFVEAQRRNDAMAARMFAEEAAKTAPALDWAGQAVLQFRCAAGDWTGALARLEMSYKGGSIDKAAYRRQRAVLLTARAQQAEESDRDEAKSLVLEAVKLAPTLLPAAALAGRLLAEAGELRKASRIIEKAWRANPHPDLADAYANLRFGDSALDRLARMRALAEKAPDHIEGALAVARAAIDAREFATAREVLAPFLAAPTRRVALIMAELEEIERADVGRAREWMARALRAARDPAWTADGFVSERWLPVSPVSGRLDAFEWKVPLAEIGVQPAPIEGQPPGAAIIEGKSVAASDTSEAVVIEPKSAPAPQVGTQTTGQGTPLPPTGRKPPEKSARGRRAPGPAPAAKVEAVIPLVRVPDDPGPDADLESEPAPEKPAEGWRRLRPFSK